MSDITREEAINILKQRQCCRECVADCKCEDCDKAFEMGIEALENQKTGHWINIDDIESECSECGHIFEVYWFKIVYERKRFQRK